MSNVMFGSPATAIWCACTTGGWTDIERHRAGQRDDTTRSCANSTTAHGIRAGARRQPRRHRPAALDDLVSLVLDWNRPVKLSSRPSIPSATARLWKARCWPCCTGIASPASADLSRAVVMSFSAAAVWRIRRAAPMLPTVLLGETSAISAAAPPPPSAPPPSGRPSRRCASTPSWWTVPRHRVGRCTAGPSTTTRTSGTAATSAWRGWRRTTPAAPRSGCRTV